MFLSVFCQDDKKRIKTESGVYISATYKTNRYAKWKERSKMAQETEDYGEQEERWLCLFLRLLTLVQGHQEGSRTSFCKSPCNEEG